MFDQEITQKYVFISNAIHLFLEEKNLNLKIKKIFCQFE